MNISLLIVVSVAAFFLLLVGLLYHMTGSLYLVGALHGTLNYIPVLLETWSQPLDRAIVYGLALGLVLLFARVREHKFGFGVKI